MLLICLIFVLQVIASDNTKILIDDTPPINNPLPIHNPPINNPPNNLPPNKQSINNPPINNPPNNPPNKQSINNPLTPQQKLANMFNTFFAQDTYDQMKKMPGEYLVFSPEKYAWIISKFFYDKYVCRVYDFFHEKIQQSELLQYVTGQKTFMELDCISFCTQILAIVALLYLQYLIIKELFFVILCTLLSLLIISGLFLWS